MTSLAEIALALDGKVEGRQVRAPGPGRPRGDRSLSVVLSACSPDGWIAHAHSSGFTWQEARDHVASRLGLARDRWRDRREPDPLTVARHRADARRAEREARVDADKRSGWAKAIFEGAEDPRATPCELYLAGRALMLDAPIAGGVLRFHPRCPYDGGRVPAMVAAMRAIEGNALRAVHRTALSPRAEKLGRMMLGPASGTAIKLDDDEAVAHARALVAAEGIESGLAARQLALGPCWALGSVGGIRNLPVIAHVDTLTICVERNDGGASEAASKVCAERWSRAGKRVRLARPSTGDDLADVVKGNRA